MERSWVLSLLLLILFTSHASSFGKSRDLVDEETQKDSNSTTKQKSPLPNVSPIGEKSNVSSSEPSLPTNNSTNPNPKEPDSVNPPPPATVLNEKNETTKVLNTTVPISPPPPANQTESQDNGKLPVKLAPPPPNSVEESGKNGTEPDKGSTPLAKDTDKVNDVKGNSDTVETCAGNSNVCRTDNSLVACTLSIEKGSGNWLILVQNEGENSLKANIVLPVDSLRELTLAKHQSQRVNISINGGTNKVILNAGKGECLLNMYPSKENTLFIHFPSYDKLVTPINGAYFLIVSVVIFGGTWAFCLCRKNRRAGNGVPYRELELSGGSGLENESGVHDVETADWDEGWDDDWDENNAVKSPGSAAKSVSISSNGLTARGPSRDGWDHDWDD